MFRKKDGRASAPEIVAGALQDTQRAKIVGEKTFGAGTVLENFSLSDGSALMLAIQEWLTPRGRNIRHQGISPDVVISLPPDVNPLFPEAEKRLTAAELRKSKDGQLWGALEVVSPVGILQAPQGRSKLGLTEVVERVF